MNVLGCYSFVEVTEPGYGRRVVLVHGSTAGRVEGGDLVTGERIQLPIGARWDQVSEREVKLADPGWSWRPVSVSVAERLAGLPERALPRANADRWPDPWIDQRLRDPVFIGVSTVLWRCPEVVFYSVDWRDFVTSGDGHGNGHARRGENGRRDTGYQSI